MYLEILDILTNIRKTISFILKTPAIIVKGSPIIGTQANNKDQTPYFWKNFSLFLRLSLDMGNHFLSLKIKIFLPKYQLNREPEMFPMLATISNMKILKFLDKYIVVRITSEEKGRNVAAKKLKSSNCRYPNTINKIIMIYFFFYQLVF